MTRATITIHHRDMLFGTPYDESIINCFRSLGATWNKQYRKWAYPATTWGLITALRALKKIGVECTSEEAWVQEALRIARTTTALMQDPEQQVSPIEREVPLYEHQKFGVELIKRSDACYIAHDMGCGKTRTVIEAIRELGCKKILIVCPRAVISSWCNQFQQYGDGKTIVMPLKQTTTKARKNAAKRALTEEWAAVVNNHEGIWRQPLGDLVSNFFWDIVVVDECHRLSGATSKRSKFFAELHWRAKRRVALSGTPIPNNPTNLWSQMMFLDPGLLGPNFNRYKGQYCEFGGFQTLPQVCPRCKQELEPMKNALWQCDDCDQFFQMYNKPLEQCHKCGGSVTQIHGMQARCPKCRKVYEARGSEIIGYKNLDRLNALFHQIAHYVRKEDVLDLPEYTDQVLEIKLSTEEKRVYKELEKNFKADIRNGEVTAANGLVRILRLQQVTGGFTRSDDGEYVTLGTSKHDVLVNYLNDLRSDEPVVVFCRFKPDLASVRAAAEETGRPYFELSGDRDEHEEWKARTGTGDVIGVQIQSGGIGIDLTRSRYALFYSLGFPLDEYEQARARVHRIGQTRNVTYTHLVAEQTVDETVYWGFEHKTDIVQAVIANLS